MELPFPETGQIKVLKKVCDFSFFLFLLFEYSKIHFANKQKFQTMANFMFAFSLVSEIIFRKKEI